MKKTIGVLGIALLLSCGSARAFAQTEAVTSKASETKIETAPTTYRLTYTITELDGSKRIGTQHISLTTNQDRNQRDARVRLGSKVPIAVASSNPDNPARTEIQYQDVGLNIGAHIHEFTTGVQVYSSLDQSSVSEEQSSVGIKDPVIRQARLENTALLTLGKPVMLGSLDIPGSTRHLDIEVVLEVVR